MRLDLYLAENSFAKSRTTAKEMIKQGLVIVDKKTIIKPSFDIKLTSIVEVVGDLPFVSRGGEKLQRAIEEFSFNVEGKTFLDVGASNGGFTDCLLKHNAKKIYAIDVGKGQLEPQIAKNKKVVVMDNTNARNLRSEEFIEKNISIVSDVSFISLTLIIPVLARISKEMLLLIKPQFECGKKALNKNGIVKNKKYHIEAIEKIFKCANENGLAMTDICIGTNKLNKNIEFVCKLEIGENINLETFYQKL